MRIQIQRSRSEDPNQYIPIQIIPIQISRSNDPDPNILIRRSRSKISRSRRRRSTQQRSRFYHLGDASKFIISEILLVVTSNKESTSPKYRAYVCDLVVVIRRFASGKPKKPPSLCKISCLCCFVGASADVTSNLRDDLDGEGSGVLHGRKGKERGGNRGLAAGLAGGSAVPVGAILFTTANSILH